MIAELEMPLTRRLVPMVLAVIVVAATIEMIRRRKLREQYAILWLLASGVLVVFAIFPGLVVMLSHVLQVNYLTIIVIACFFFLAMIVMHFAVVISHQAEQIRRLAERVALMQNELRRGRSSPPEDTQESPQAQSDTTAGPQPAAG
ncbi:MAG: DUF2304 domain-containing protein [Phycisphaerae bacterium]